MDQTSLSRLADVLVNYSLALQPGQWLDIGGSDRNLSHSNDGLVALPALRAVYRAALQAGANPTLSVGMDDFVLDFLELANDKQLRWVNPLQKMVVEQADAVAVFLATNDTRSRSNIDPRRLQKVMRARRGLSETLMQRTGRDGFRWVLVQYPTEAFAAEAGMSLAEYEAFVAKAMFLDQPDPVQAWRDLSAMQQSKIDFLKNKHQVKLRGPNIDMTLSIAGRKFINADGHYNMPDGEIFSGPVEESVNGWVRFTYPTIMGGRRVSDVELRFMEGRVVYAQATENEDVLLTQLNTDSGARYLGEFAFSTNFGIDRFTHNILFDEKIGGTVHMALGASYPMTGGRNQSAIHWDLICDMRQDSEVYVDGDLFYKNGAFAI